MIWMSCGVYFFLVAQHLIGGLPVRCLASCCRVAFCRACSSWRQLSSHACVRGASGLFSVQQSRMSCHRYGTYGLDSLYVMVSCLAVGTRVADIRPIVSLINIGGVEVFERRVIFIVIFFLVICRFLFSIAPVRSAVPTLVSSILVSWVSIRTTLIIG
jgi:hypothetical protein